MKVSFKSIATTFKNLFVKKVKDVKPAVWHSPKPVIPEKKYNKTGVSFYYFDNDSRCNANKVNRRRNRNKIAKKSRQINRKAA